MSTSISPKTSDTSVNFLVAEEDQGQDVLNADEPNDAVVGEEVRPEVAPEGAEASAEGEAQPSTPAGVPAPDTPRADIREVFDEVPETEATQPRRVLPDPGQPSESEMEEHRIDHIPYRCWCPECVAGRARGEQHRKPRDQKRLPVLVFDYLFITKDKKIVDRNELLANKYEVAMKILVAHDTWSKAVFAHVVASKGPNEDKYAVDCLTKDVQWLGFNRLGLRSDNENAILKLLQESLKSLRITTEVNGANARDGQAREGAPEEEPQDRPQVPDQVFEEHPSRYDSAANGAIENAIKRLTGLLRTHKLCLERRIGKSIPADHPLLTWMVEMCAWLLTTRVLGEDGMSAIQRLRGRPYGKRLVGFGEKVQYKLPTKGPEHDPDGKLSRRWPYGTVLGYSTTSPDCWIYSDGEVFTARSVQRLAFKDRWDAATLEGMQVVKHSMYRPRARDVRFGEDVAGHPAHQGPRRAFKALELRQADFEKHGYTDGCPKCDHAMRYGWGQTTQHHDATCKQRMMDALWQTATGRRRIEEWRARERRWLAEEVERRVAPPEGESGEVDGHREPLPPAPGRFDEPDPLEAAPPPERVHREVSDAPEGHGNASEGGDAAPATPTLPHRGSPESAVGDPSMEDLPELPPGENADMYTDHVDVQSLIDVCAAEPEMCDELEKDAKAIMQVVRDLGGNRREYAHEWRKAMSHIVSEVFSPPRVTKVLKMMPSLRMLPGYALDLTTCGEEGNAWDFDKFEMRQKARKLIAEQKPYVLIGSPQCTPYSSLQAMNASKRDPLQVQRERTRADIHLQFTMELYKDQIAGGRYFIHEHPAWATSWDTTAVRELLEMDGVDEVVGDQCQYCQVAANEGPLRSRRGSCQPVPMSWRCSANGAAAAVGHAVAQEEDVTYHAAENGPEWLPCTPYACARRSSLE